MLNLKRTGLALLGTLLFIVFTGVLGASYWWLITSSYAMIVPIVGAIILGGIIFYAIYQFINLQEG